MSSGVITLEHTFPSRYGAPTIDRVDPRIFTLTYYTECLTCSFCSDWCCQHGVDVDRIHHDAILKHADGI